MTDRTVFLSCARVDAGAAGRLERVLQSAGIRVERGEAPGDAAVFLACFSADGLFRDRAYQYGQFSQAAGQPVPVRFDECEVPAWDLPDGRTLRDLPAADVFGDQSLDGAASVVASVRAALGPETGTPEVGAPENPAATPVGAKAAAPKPAAAKPAKAPPADGPGDEGLAGRVRNAQFASTRMRPGYDQREVDEFLDRIEAEATGLVENIRALEAAGAGETAPEWSPSVTLEDVRNQRFTTARFRPGYDAKDVDRFLETAAVSLGRLTALREDRQSRLSR